MIGPRSAYGTDSYIRVTYASPAIAVLLAIGSLSIRTSVIKVASHKTCSVKSTIKAVQRNEKKWFSTYRFILVLSVLA